MLRDIEIRVPVHGFEDKPGEGSRIPIVLVSLRLGQMAEHGSEVRLGQEREMALDIVLYGGIRVMEDLDVVHQERHEAGEVLTCAWDLRGGLRAANEGSPVAHKSSCSVCVAEREALCSFRSPKLLLRQQPEVRYRRQAQPHSGLRARVNLRGSRLLRVRDHPKVPDHASI